MKNYYKYLEILEADGVKDQEMKKISKINLASLAKWLSVRLQTKWFKFKSRWSNINFRYPACFEQGVPWHPGNYKCGFTRKRVRDMIRTYSQTIDCFGSASPTLKRSHKWC